MNGRVLALTALVGLLGLAALAYVMLNYLATPLFQVTNATEGPVKLTAYWRDHYRDLGELAAGGTLRFSVNDEAALSFRARLANGEQLVSKEIYFTSGTRVITEVATTGITLRYAFEQ